MSLETILLIAIGYLAIVVMALSICVVAGRADRVAERPAEQPPERSPAIADDDLGIALTEDDAAFFKRLGRRVSHGHAEVARRGPPGLR